MRWTSLRIGVDRVVDFAEVLDKDLVDMGMPPLQRRRFKAAVAARVVHHSSVALRSIDSIYTASPTEASTCFFTSTFYTCFSTVVYRQWSRMTT